MRSNCFFFCDESLNLHDFDDVFVDVTYVLLSLLLPQKNTCRHLPLKNAPKEGRALMGETELSTGSVLRSRNRFQVIRGSEKKVFPCLGELCELISPPSGSLLEKKIRNILSFFYIYTLGNFLYY